MVYAEKTSDIILLYIIFSNESAFWDNLAVCILERAVRDCKVSCGEGKTTAKEVDASNDIASNRRRAQFFGRGGCPHHILAPT